MSVLALANARPNESAVGLHAYFAAGQKVRHSGDGFLGVFRARTHRDDEVTERKFGLGFEDEGMFFH